MKVFEKSFWVLRAQDPLANTYDFFFAIIKKGLYMQICARKNDARIRDGFQINSEVYIKFI